MKSGYFLQVGNGEAVAGDQIPQLSFEDFRSEILYNVDSGGKIVQYFAYPDGKNLKLLSVLRNDENLLAGSCVMPATYPSLTPRCEPLHMFEREIAEQYGVHPAGHPWLKMVRYHPNYRGVADVFGNDYEQDIPGNYDYYSVEGEEIHEVAVGPVHAGVIEPGHFRFNCIGERVLNLEIQLGYQHRGIERTLLKCDPKRYPILAEGIAGDTAVGHSLCMAQAFEGLAGKTVDPGARVIRTVAFELERIANHVGDLGALSGDVAFLPPANYCGRMRGDFLNMSLWICGNRFGKGLVRPGGVVFPLTDEDREVLDGRIAELQPQVKHTIELLFSTSSVRARFENCGTVSKQDAEKLGLVGPAGRACGVLYDARKDLSHRELSQPVRAAKRHGQRRCIRQGDGPRRRDASVYGDGSFHAEKAHRHRMRGAGRGNNACAFVLRGNGQRGLERRTFALRSHRRERTDQALQDQGPLLPQLERVVHVSEGHGDFRLFP